MNAVILSAGSVPHEIAALFRTPSVGLIPINGRPLVAMQFDFLRSFGVQNFKLAVRRNDNRLKEYVRQHARLFGLSVQIVDIDSDRGPGGTLLATIEPEDLAAGVFVLLGDTLLEAKHPTPRTDTNEIYTAPVEDPERWCMIDCDLEGAVTALEDKPEKTTPSAEAAIGCYWFGRIAPDTWSGIRENAPTGRVELSYILRQVSQQSGLRRKSTEGWLDCGNVDLLLATRRKMVAARSFNTLKIDELRGTVRKCSQHGDKFRHEINYYRLLPHDLSVFFPRLISFETAQPGAHVELEYYAYPTLSEVYIYEEYRDSFWTAVFDKLGAILAEFSRRSVRISPDDCSLFYTSKLMRRLEDAQRQSLLLAPLLSANEICLNGKTLRGVPRIVTALDRELTRLSQAPLGAVIHGDICFSNILVEPLNKTIRLIDPRGSFHEVGIFGDARYDHAKLWHSVDGHYDAIINDMFGVKAAGVSLEFDCFRPRARDHILHCLEQLVPAGASRRDLRLIEGSLFLSMLPLHGDHPRRQLAMLSTGLAILNEEL